MNYYNEDDPLAGHNLFCSCGSCFDKKNGIAPVIRLKNKVVIAGIDGHKIDCSCGNCYDKKNEIKYFNSFKKESSNNVKKELQSLENSNFLTRVGNNFVESIKGLFVLVAIIGGIFSVFIPGLWATIGAFLFIGKFISMSSKIDSINSKLNEKEKR